MEAKKRKFLLFLVFFLLPFLTVSQLTNIPNNYLPYDEYFDDDLQSVQQFHHIVNAFSFINAYIDEYSGVYYLPNLKCGYYSSESSITIDYTTLANIDLTNLKGLYSLGCIHNHQYNKINIYHPREKKEAVSKASIRLSNPRSDKKLVFNANTCSSIYNNTCQGPIPIEENIVIEPRSILKYEIKWTSANYYTSTDNFQTEYINTGGTKIKDEFTLFFMTVEDPDENERDPNALLAIHSLVLSVDLLSEIRSISGNTFNFCDKKGCIMAGRCQVNDNAVDRYCYHIFSNTYFYPTDCSRDGCIENTYCKSSNTICSQCDMQCRTCFSGSANDCRSCFRNSISPQWYRNYQFTTAKKCTYEFNNMAIFSDFSIDIPVPLSYRITIEFWAFIHDTTNELDSLIRPALSSYVIKDFMAMGFMQSAANSKDIEVIVVPFETFFPFTEDITSINGFNAYKTQYPSLQYASGIVNDPSSKWVYFRGGVSYTHKKMFVNQEPEKDLQYIPFYTGDTTTTYQSLLRKFFRKDEKTKLVSQGFEFVNTEIYIRNLNIYSEYLNNNINYPNYFNLHKITNILNYPQLLYSIPFNDIIIDSSNSATTLTGYDFSGQFTSDVTAKHNQVQQDIISLEWVRSPVNPPKNFKRIKFLDVNTQYNTADLKATNAITCGTNNVQYCQENDKAYVCNNGFNLLPDTAKDFLKCTNDCVENLDKYMVLPNIKVNQGANSKITRNYCGYKCDDTIVDNCPTQSNSNINSFSCNATPGYQTLFFQCLDTTTHPPEKSAMQFSGTYQTKSMEINLAQPLKNFYIEMWIHPDLLTQKNPPIYKTHFFMTDSHEIYYDDTDEEFQVRVRHDGLVSLFSFGQKISYFGWNHLVFASLTKQKGLSSEISVSLTNSFVPVGSVVGETKINKVCFCNKDQSCCGVSDVLWFDVFIKEIKIWNAEIVSTYTLFDFDKFAHVIPGGLLYWFPLTIDNLNNNKITDKIGGTIQVSFPYDQFFLNPDNDMNFNYAWNFNWNDIHYPDFISEVQIENSNKVTITLIEQCDTGCAMCFGTSKFTCFKCNDGYALSGSTCTKTSKNDGYYYYINPLTDPNLEFELDFASLNLNTFPSITLFFYLKLYGFTAAAVAGNDYTIFTFSTTPLYQLVYVPATFQLNLVLDGVIQFTYENYVDHFGNWVPISISAFRAPSLTLQNNLVSMTVNFTPLDYLGGNTYPNFPYETFKFSKGVIAEVAELTLYNIFIINAYGYGQHKTSSTPGSFFTEPNPIIIKTFQLRTKEPTKECIKTDDVANFAGYTGKIKCIEDYLNYDDQECKDDQFVQLTSYNLPPQCVSNPSKCDNIVQTIKKMDNCDYLYSTCDNISSNSINNLIFAYTPISSTKKYIRCGPSNTLDIARYQSGNIPNIQNPTDEFKLEFWFITQSYVNINFGSFTADWKEHIKITVGYDQGRNKFYGYCEVLGQATNNLQFDYADAVVQENIWRYVVCGVNVPENKFYLTNLQKENLREGTITTPGAFGGTITLQINENSLTNYGVTYIKEMRLWNCFDCSSDRAFVPFNKDDPFFSKVIHYFKFEDVKGLVMDYKTKPSTGDPNVSIQLVVKVDFNGYGLLNAIPDLPNCNESGSSYFSLKNGKGCDIMFNFNIFQNDVEFKEIPASKSNKYTMDFWFYVESSDDFLNGFSIIYDNHMAISTYAQTLTDQDLTVYCFPQAYRDNLFGIKGNDILTKFNNAQNKIKDTYVNSYSKWNYVRCAYSFDLQKLYLNNLAEQNIIPEIFFTTPTAHSNNMSLKFFMNNYVKVVVHGAKDNFTRIFIQTINIFRDYIPQVLNFKYMSMKQYAYSVSSSQYYPLLFAVDFQNDYDIIKNRLKYFITDFDYIPETEQYIGQFMTHVISRSYLTYPVYDDFLQCTIGKVYNQVTGKCDFILSPNNCDNKKVFCLDNDKYFWCQKGKYLDINTFQCNDNCPTDYTRPPDMLDGYGMCYVKGDDMNYQTWPTLNAELVQEKYQNSFTCKAGFIFINYHCVPNSLNDNSGLYFSNKYMFNNMVANYAELLLKNYFVDFWFMFENVEEYRYVKVDPTAEDERYYIFIAYPHFISRYQNEIQYTNSFMPLSTYTIGNINKYNWNHIVIENYVIEGTTLADTYKYINVYVNNNYVTPEVSLKISKTNDFSLSQIAFCHKENAKYSKCNLGLNSFTYKIYEPLWEDAYYRDITVWNWDITGIPSITYFNSNKNKVLTMNIVSYHPMTLNTINLNKIESLTTYKGKQFDFESRLNTQMSYDNSQNINWFTDYDRTYPNFSLETITNTYTDSINTPYFSLSTTQYTRVNCPANCDRCFENDNSKCISCLANFVLTGTECVAITNYYFKTPMNNYNTMEVIDLKYSIDPATYHEITIMFYMRFMGTVIDKTGIAPIVYFFNRDNYLAWDNDNNNFAIMYNTNQVAFEYKDSRASIGKWALYAISIYLSSYPNIFPNMIQFMIDQVMIHPTDDFVSLMATTQISFNKISISNKVSAYYYDFRVYRKFFIGAYALGQDPNSATHTYLLYNFKLSSNANDDSCLTTNDIDTGTSNLGTGYCEGDDNKYENSAFTCPNIPEQFRVINAIANNFNCNVCDDNYCNSKCFSTGNKGCMCSYDSTIYWLRNLKTQNLIHCERPNSLNINEFGNIQITDIDVGSSSSYMIEMWVFIYSYISEANFNGIDVIWDKFIRLEIDNTGGTGLKINCYPYSDSANLAGAYSQFATDTSIQFKKWTFIRCTVDKTINTITLNDKSKVYTEPIPSSQPTSGTTKLIIRDKLFATPSPYGVVLLRELRLWDTKNNLFYDTSRLNLATDHTYTNLIHYFKNIYTNSNADNNRNYVYDEKKQKKTTISPILNPYPYSYIDESLTDLVLCEEGYVYKLNTINNKYECTLYGSDDILNNVKEDDTLYTPSDLLSKSKILYETAINNYEAPSTVSNIFTEIQVGSDSKVTMTDPITSNAYCSNRGYAKIVDHSLTCYCFSDYVGKYCQLANTDYANIDKVFTNFIEKAKKTYTKYISEADSLERAKIISSLEFLIDGSGVYSIDNSFITNVVNWFKSEVIYDVTKCDVDYIRLTDKLYGNNIQLTNYYKVGVMTNTDGRNTHRNGKLNYLQTDELKTNAQNLKKFLEYLTSLCFKDLTDSQNSFNYKSDNVNIDLFRMTSSYNLETTLETTKKGKYEPFISVENCASVLFEKNKIINLQYITWYHSPYYYDSDLYWNYTSHHLTVKMYTTDLDQIPVTECKDKKIMFYFSVYNPDLVDVINDNKFHFIKENVYNTNDSIFTEPKYIESSGKINNLTREERIEKYYFEYQLILNSLDAKTMSYTTTGMQYENITLDNYLAASSTHLSEFILNYIYNEFPNKIDGRLYFIKHLNLFLYGENYNMNYGFFLILLILGIYVINFIICFFGLKHKLNSVQKKRYKLILDFLEKYAFPYGNVEGEFLFKQENGNKIYNEEFNNYTEKEENQKDNKNSNNNKALLSTEAPPLPSGEILTLNKLPTVPVGDIYDKKVFENFFSTMADDIVIPEIDGAGKFKPSYLEKENGGKEVVIIKKIKAHLETKGIVEETMKEEDSEGDNSLPHNNYKTTENKKKSRQVDAYNNNFMIIENQKVDEDMETNMQFKDENYKHNLLIYNEDMRIKGYQKMKLNPCKFLWINFKNRNMFISTFRENATYTAVIKSLYLPMYLALNLFINTFIYLFQETMTYDTIFGEDLIKFILFCLISIIASNLYFYIKSNIYYISKSKIRDLLFKFKTSKKKFDAAYIQILKRHKIGYIIETILFFVFTFISFLFSFGLSAVYDEQGKCMFASFVVCIVVDFILSFIVEVIIMLLYMCRKNQILVIVLDYLNRAKSLKVISP